MPNGRPSAQSLPEPNSEQLLNDIAERYQNDPGFHARVHLAWSYSAQPEFFTDRSETVLQETKAAVICALYIDDIARDRL